MSMDFPSSPVNGQTTTDGRYYFDSSVGSSGAWRSAPLPVGGLPAGSIIQWSSNTAPTNWLLCDGSAVSRSTYSSLFAVIGTTYGAGNGTTTFNLPDLRGRVPVGRNGGTFGTLGATGGAETHTLTVDQMPSHSHNVKGDATNAAPAAWASEFSLGPAAAYTKDLLTTSVGGGQAHNNLQPYQVVNYIIKASAGWTAGDSELATRLGVVETANASTNKAGLVPVIPTSVAVGSGSASVGANGVITLTGASTASLNGVFTSGYTNYRINIFDTLSSGNGVLLQMRMRLNGVDSSADYYFASQVVEYTGTTSTRNGNASTLTSLGEISSFQPGCFSSRIEMMSPQNTSRTSFHWQANGQGNNQSHVAGAGIQVSSNTFDGVTFLTSSGNFSGKIQVYGYR